MQDLILLKMIDDAILSTNNYTVERASILFLACTAKFQILWENQLYQRATNFYLIMLKEIRYMKIYYQIFMI